jgi:signal transduction histidine kinase
VRIPPPSAGETRNSHEFRYGNLTGDAGRERESLFRRIFSLANVIEHGATRTARIIRDLKTFSEPGSEAYSEFELHTALDMCLNLLGSQLKGRIRIERDYGPVEPVHGPYGQLNQVFMNLLANAQQAISGEGQITVATRQSGERVSVSIRDTGSGIPEEIRSRIFDPFFTTKEPGVGTGLGLSLSYGIVKQLGGSIDCQSTPGQGSEFVVEFPRRAAEAALAAESDAEARESSVIPAQAGIQRNGGNDGATVPPDRHSRAGENPAYPMQRGT